MKESFATNLYDLVHAEQFVPFSILFASGRLFEIKTREHISLGPVSRSGVERLKAVIVWDDAGESRSVYIPAILKIEELHPYGAEGFLICLAIIVDFGGEEPISGLRFNSIDSRLRNCATL